MNPRIEFYKAGFSQRGNGFDMPVLRGTSKYQYNQGVAMCSAVFCGLFLQWRGFSKPLAIKGAKTLLKLGSEAIKEGATIKDVIKSTLKPTVGAVLGATVD